MDGSMLHAVIQAHVGHMDIQWCRCHLKGHPYVLGIFISTVSASEFMRRMWSSASSRALYCFSLAHWLAKLMIVCFGSAGMLPIIINPTRR
jgi:hypothetical protein